MIEKDKIFLSPRKRFDITKDPPTVILGEVMFYMGDERDVAVEKAKNARKAIAAEWREKKPESPTEINKFYTETKGYIYDLFTWPHDKQMWGIFDKLITPEMRVLDYGCGIGDVAIYLAEKGCDVVATDLDTSNTLQFCMWRVYQRGLGGKIKFKFDPRVDRFDVVLAIDVLEHLFFPLRYAVMLGGLLKNPDSFFFCTPTFANDTGDYPMHIEDNFWLRENFIKAMVSLGFKPEFPNKKYYPAWYPVFLDDGEKKD